MTNPDIITFIMAGGKGERLYPLTKDRAKPAVPFGGMYRIIDFTLSNCLNSGLRRIYVLTQYKSLSLSRHILRGWNVFNPQVDGYIEVVPAQLGTSDTWYKGTADAVFQNMYLITEENPKYCLILSGDHVYKMNYSNLVNFYKEKNADFVIGVLKMPSEKSKLLGVCQINEQEKLIGFQEKPNEPARIPADEQNIYGSMGIYLVKTEVLKEILQEYVNKKSKYDFGKDIIPSIYKDKNVFVYDFNKYEKFGSYWRDVGTIDDYYNSNMDLVGIVPEFNLYDREWPIRTYIEQYPPAKTVYDGKWDPSRKAEATQSLLSNGVIVSGGKVAQSILSPHVRVNSFSSVESSVIMENVNIGRYAKIKKTIIDKDVDIPPNVEIGYNIEEDKKRFHVTDSGIVVVAKRKKIHKEKLIDK